MKTILFQYVSSVPVATRPLMSDEIFEFKPDIGPFKLNVGALLRKFFQKKKSAVKMVDIFGNDTMTIIEVSV
jgi:hypothetical protein